MVAREIKVEIPHPTAGKVALVRSPMWFSETPIEYIRRRRFSASTRTRCCNRCLASRPTRLRH
ncbi:MAG: hypothetical protein R3D67_08690 [Hyphomicrobiaceae bacterium]